MLPLVTSLLPIVGKVLDRVLPDEEAKRNAKLEMLRLADGHELQLLSTQMSAIVAEAKSQDPFTSRARPSFLYVVYAYILAAIPFAFIFWLSPESAKAATEGVKLWLDSIPEPMWWLFGTGYLGYTGARSIDKRGMYKMKKDAGL